MMLQQIGTDTEFFVSKAGVMSHAINAVGGTKEAPLWVVNGNLQEDNVLAEMAINPQSTKSAFLKSIKGLRRELASTMKSNNLRLEDCASYEYSMSELMDFPESALVLGCEPDLNAYTGDYNERPDAYQPLRTAAGHVHFSYENPFKTVTQQVIINMDYLLGLWSVFSDPDTKRRELYGKSGAYRLKSYGGEYRVLSNFWIFDDSCINFVYDMTKMAVEDNEHLQRSLPYLLPVVEMRRIIDNCDIKSAQLHYEAIASEVGYELS